MERWDFERVEADNTIKTFAHLTIPTWATHVYLQAGTANIRYRLDSENPTATNGMRLVAGNPPELFEIKAILNGFTFIREGGTNAGLLVHYCASRTI